MQVITLLPLSVIGNMHFLGLSNKNIHLAVVFVLFCRKPSMYCSVIGCCGTFGLFLLNHFISQIVWKNIHFVMWDIGGQESLRSAWNTYYTNTEVSFHHYKVYIV